MSIAHELFVAGVIPLLAAAVVAYFLQRFRLSPKVAWTAGVAMGMIAGQCALASRRGFARAIQQLVVPREAGDWLPAAVLLAMGITILAANAPRRWRLPITALAALLAVSLPLRLLAGHVAQQWSGLERVAYLALLAASLALVWLLLATNRDEELAWLRAPLLVVASLGAAIVMTLSGSFTIGRSCGVVAAAVAGTALVARRGLSGAAGVVAIGLGGFIILGVFYARLHAANAALLAFAIVAAAGRVPDFFSDGPARRAVVRVTLCLIPLAIALARCLNG
jgi:hypothetical protein